MAKKEINVNNYNDDAIQVLEGLDAVRKRLLAAFDGSLIVTPREIDDIISAVADLIAAAFIQAVHPCADESNYYLYLR